ncbi:hypothetical protein D3C86_1755370 [compost metagenome]
MQARPIKLHQPLLVSVHALIEARVRIRQHWWLTQVQKRRQHPGNLLGTDPRRIFDPRLVVGDRGRVSGKALKAGTIGDPGRQ